MILHALNKIYELGKINKIDLLATFSYLTTPLVSQSIAERLIINEDENTIRYMSKQNVHQNILRKTIDNILKYIKNEMPEYFKTYFPRNYEDHLLNLDTDSKEII